VDHRADVTQLGGAPLEFCGRGLRIAGRAMGGEDAGLRAALIVSSILGLTIARHFLKLDAFTSASDTDIARVARPWVTTGVDPASGEHPRASTQAG
jgi:hypothetical protein